MMGSIVKERSLESFGGYELHEVLGKGPLGCVYRAIDPCLSRTVAVKIFHPELTRIPNFLDSFKQKLLIAARLDHPGMITIYDMNELDGRLFVMMKYVPGGSLAKLLLGGALRADIAISILLQVCESLEIAHAKGLIHYNLKPTNILLNTDGRVIISDFGLAQGIAGTSGSFLLGGMSGMFLYRAPELWHNDLSPAPNVDVYSLGCILAEMLTGVSPFRGDSSEDVLTQHLIKAPNFGPNWPMSGMPDGLEAIIVRALDKDPAKRYTNASALLAALRAVGPTLPLRPVFPVSQNTQSQQKSENSDETCSQLVQDLPEDSGDFTDPDLFHMYEDGIRALSCKDWERASYCFQAIVQIWPGYRDSARRLTQAQQQIDWRQRYLQAQEQIECSNWAGALPILEKLNNEVPDYLDVPRLIQQYHLQSLYADAYRYHQAGQWKMVVEVFAEIHKLRASYPDPLELLSTAHAQLHLQERDQKLANLYIKAVQAYHGQRWNDAVRILNELVALAPDYHDATSLLEEARTESIRRQPVRENVISGTEMLWLIAFIVIVIISLLFAMASPSHAPVRGSIDPQKIISVSIPSLSAGISITGYDQAINNVKPTYLSRLIGLSVFARDASEHKEVRWNLLEGTNYMRFWERARSELFTGPPIYI